jgi:formate-dependent nitrite reductase membrane component NrfD
MSVRPELGATRAATEGGPSPSGRPVIKPPVWTFEIPLYFYFGGLAGASAGLALLSDLRGEHALARRAWATALAGGVVSPVLLISDLGRPRRFLNMLRLFKVTSPMSVGSWILSAFGATTGVAALHAPGGGRLGPVGRGAQAASAALGLPVASYTGALVGNTPIPAWHHGRHELPFVFAAGAAMSAGAAAVALGPTEETAAARRLAVGGAVAEQALMMAMQHRLAAVGVGHAYHHGVVGWLTKAATALGVAGAAAVAAGGRRSRRVAVAGGALLTAAALAERWSVFRAGFGSAMRPGDTVEPQRTRIASGASRGAARREPRAAAERSSTDGRLPGERPATPGSPAIAP